MQAGHWKTDNRSIERVHLEGVEEAGLAGQKGVPSQERWSRHGRHGPADESDG